MANIIKKIQNKSTELSLLLSIPGSLGLIIASEEITNALFGYGSFSEKNVLITAEAIKYFGYGVPAFALIKVLSNFFFARDNTLIPFYLSFFIVLLNIIISLSFFNIIGFIIIPIATSTTTWLGILLYIYLLKKRNFFNIEINFLKNFFKILLSSLFMSLILHYGLDYFSDSLAYNNKFKSIYLIFIVGFVATIYLVSCYLLGVLKIKNYKTS